MDEFNTTRIVFGTIPAMHRGKNAIRGRLQGHVKVLSNAIGGGEKTDQILRHIQWLDGTDTQSFNRRFIQNAAEQVEKFETRRKVAAIRAQVDAAQDDLAISGACQTLHFRGDRIGRQTTRFAAHKRDYAKGTA